MISFLRPVTAFALVALQLVLPGWGPCLAAVTPPVEAAAAAPAENATTHGRHHGASAPVSDEAPSRTQHDGSPCPMMGACGQTGIHQGIVADAGSRPDHLMVRTLDAVAPDFLVPSPEPPPPRG